LRMSIGMGVAAMKPAPGVSPQRERKVRNAQAVMQANAFASMILESVRAYV
jgi:hypothetical protein